MKTVSSEWRSANREILNDKKKPPLQEALGINGSDYLNRAYNIRIMAIIIHQISILPPYKIIEAVR